MDFSRKPAYSIGKAANSVTMRRGPNIFISRFYRQQRHDIIEHDGISRQSGFSAPFRWAWEIKTVNSKGLDLRLRLPPGFDSLDVPVRAAISKILARGACYANLTAARESPSVTARLNRELSPI